MSSRDFAVVIGIDKYDEIDGLDGACNDAQEFVRWLKESYSLANIDDRDLLLTIGNPKASELYKALADLWKKVNRVGGRRLYIFYAGHGCGTNLNSAGVYASDFRKDFDYACYDLIGTANLLRSSGRFREVVVFMDCCRGFDYGHTAVPVSPRWLTSSTQPAAHFYCLACGLGDITRERRFGEEIRGVFSIHLMGALQGNVDAAMDTDGNVTAHSLRQFLSKLLPNTDCEPREEQILKDLVLAKGFTRAPSSFEVKLTEPEKGFGLYRSEPFGPLAWKTEMKDGKILVHREYQDAAAIITVPGTPPFERSRAIFPQDLSAEI